MASPSQDFELPEVVESMVGKLRDFLWQKKHVWRDARIYSTYIKYIYIYDTYNIYIYMILIIYIYDTYNIYISIGCPMNRRDQFHMCPSILYS